MLAEMPKWQLMSDASPKNRAGVRPLSCGRQGALTRDPDLTDDPCVSRANAFLIQIARTSLMMTLRVLPLPEFDQFAAAPGKFSIK
jgi:hypothetical protein